MFKTKSCKELRTSMSNNLRTVSQGSKLNNDDKKESLETLLSATLTQRKWYFEGGRVKKAAQTKLLKRK